MFTLLQHSFVSCKVRVINPHRKVAQYIFCFQKRKNTNIQLFSLLLREEQYNIKSWINFLYAHFSHLSFFLGLPGPFVCIRQNLFLYFFFFYRTTYFLRTFFFSVCVASGGFAFTFHIFNLSCVIRFLMCMIYYKSRIKCPNGIES